MQPFMVKTTKEFSTSRDVPMDTLVMLLWFTDGTAICLFKDGHLEVRPISCIDASDAAEQAFNWEVGLSEDEEV